MALRVLLSAVLAAAGALAAAAALDSEEQPAPPAPSAIQVAGPALDDRLTGSAAERLESVRPWRTDLGRRAAPSEEFLPVVPRDVIAAIDRPRAVPVRSARGLHAGEPVIAVTVGRAARAYPVRILVWHEIVNDRLGGRPIVVTYCPLCNSSLVFDRRARGNTLTFSTTGNLRRGNLVMYDRQTESWWQQFTGTAVVGELTGARLRPRRAQTLSFADFAAGHPDGTVLSFDTGFDRPYRTNPYAGYERPADRPGLFRGRLDLRLPPKERVVVLHGEREVVAVPLTAARRRGVVTVTVEGRSVAVLFKPGARSPLQSDDPSEARDVGAVGAFRPVASGRPVRLATAGEGFRDARTGSRFDITGRARSGPLAGARLPRVRHDVQLWFAVAAFAPDVRLP